MILIEDLSSYNFTLSLGQTQDFIIDSLEKEFKSKHGEELFSKCSLVILVENENFYHVIKNKYKTRVSGELMQNFYKDVESHL